jgi:tetratricopeptide (TPR) repeat protein
MDGDPQQAQDGDPRQAGDGDPWRARDGDPWQAAPQPAANRPASAPGTWLAEAIRLHETGRFAEAEAQYRRILAAEPAHPDALLLFAAVAVQTGRAALAQDLLARAIVVAPDTVPYQANLGRLLHLLGRSKDALPFLHRVAERDPDNPAAHRNLGNALQRLGRLAEAAGCHVRAIALQPDYAEAFDALGNVRVGQNRLDEAAACYRQAVAANPDLAGAHGNLGGVLFRQGRFDEAAISLHRAIALDPALELPHFYLAEVAREQDRPAEAVAAYRAAIARNPHRAMSHQNLGATLMRLGRPAEAAACYRTAIRLQPDFPEPHDNLGMALLMLGELPEGWREREWRWRIEPAASVRRDFPQPQWRGEPAAGQTLLVHAEQGFGDTLQFCRLVPLAREQGLRVVLEVPAALVRLMHGLAGIDAVVAAGDALPPFDWHCPMQSLPLALGTTLDSIPGATPYLFADSAVAAAWHERLAPLAAAGPRIGLVWAGNPRSHWPEAAKVDRRRSVPLARLAPWFDIPGLQFFSLQPGGAAAAAGLKLIDYMDSMHDFADTAALVANLDLVISADTAVAHLAGALGRPVMLLDRFDHCWRWLAGRLDSPWYPAMRIYRQPAPGDWDAVVAEAAVDLRALAEAWQAGFAAGGMAVG